jgi:hypothetical protein
MVQWFFSASANAGAAAFLAFSKLTFAPYGRGAGDGVGAGVCAFAIANPQSNIPAAKTRVTSVLFDMRIPPEISEHEFAHQQQPSHYIETRSFFV